jgi:hypothetical protein
MAKKIPEPDATDSSTPARRRSMRAAPRSTAGDEDARRDVTHDEIAEAAYRRYLSRGGEHGRDFDDWVEAERELRLLKSQ